ncbi:unnamed protein product, partial [Prorocentrum cordatum]
YPPGSNGRSFTLVKGASTDAMMVETLGGVVQRYAVAADSIDDNADTRALPAAWRNNARRQRFAEAVDLMQYRDCGDSPLEGEASALWYLGEIARCGEGGPFQRHCKWAHQLNAGGGRSVHEHVCIMEVLELAAEIDQLNAPTLVSLEALGRRAALIERARPNSPGGPDYAGADDFIGWGPRRGKAPVAPTLVKHVAEQARDKAASDEEAARALLGGRVPYAGGDDLTVVPYDRALASIPGDGRIPAPLSKRPPLDAAKMIVDFDTNLPKDDNQRGAEAGRVRGGASVFFAQKKSGNQRLVVDCRRVNARFRECPRAPMGSGGPWADDAMGTGTGMCLSRSDAKDYFYACELAPWLGSFSCLLDITGGELKSIADGDPFFGYLRDVDSIAPPTMAMPMGWARSSFFAQVLHAREVSQIRDWPPGAVMQGRAPPPPFRAGPELAPPRRDNFAAAAPAKARADALREDSERRMISLAFEVHEEEEAARRWLESLGLAIDGLTGGRRPSPVKAWRLRQVCRRLRRLPQLLHYHAVPLPPAAELRAAAAALPLARASARRPWSPEAEVFDSSTAGCGILSASLPEEVVAEMGKTDERWRRAFQREQPAGPRALRAAPPVEECFSNVETVLPRDWTRKRRQPARDFPEAPPSISRGFEWRECVAGRRRHEEHPAMLGPRGADLCASHLPDAAQP